MDRSHVLYPVIFKDHDGTWTFTVDSGKSGEESHKVHARETGYHTQGAARKAARERIELIKANAAKDAPIGEQPATGEPEAEKPASPAGGKKAKAVESDFPDWAVVAGKKITAIFLDEASAEAYGTDRFGKKFRVARISYRPTLD